MEQFAGVLVAFYVILMVVGIPGNLLVVLVTASRITKKSVHVLIIALAVADLMACCLLPFGIHYWLTFNDHQSWILCKINVFTNFLGVFTSMFLTNAVAFDRYFAVCHPLETFFNLQRSYVVCVGCFVCAFLCSVPSVFAFDIRSSEPLRSQCTVTVNTWLVQGIYGVFVFTFLLSAGVLIILYLHMCIKIRRQVHFRARVAAYPAPVHVEAQPAKSGGIQTISNQVHVASSSTSATDARYITESLNVSDPSIIPPPPACPLLEVPTNVKSAWHKKSSKAELTPRPLQEAGHRHNHIAVAVANAMSDKTTKMLIMSTAVFIASWLPNILIKAMSSTQYYQLESHPALLITIRIFEYLYLINHAVNPFVYSLVNKRFRGACALYLKNLRRKLTN